MRTLRTSSLQLEPQLSAHAHEMFEVLSDPAIYEFENKPPGSEQALAARYARLESRQSSDGRQRWLNWVVRVASGELAGYVQATVLSEGVALVAYELGSRFWRQGIGSEALVAVISELRSEYAVSLCTAVLKARNFRSLRLLHKLGFQPASPERIASFGAGPDEVVMVKPLLSEEKAT